MTPAEMLADGVVALGLTALIGTEAQARLLAYLSLLDKWNRTHNLTAIREAERMITHHLLDSLAVLPHLPARARLRLIDVGSGGGLPGIPLAIVRPDWQFALLDSNFKKAAFLRQAAIELPLANVEVVSLRVQDYVPATGFDIAISRAFSDLAVFAAASGGMLVPGGRLVAMKGVYPHEELADLPPGIGVTGTPALKIPGLEGERHLVIMELAA
jgi:16S rRNA (guanine527-N7)-methyltransferase